MEDNGQTEDRQAETSSGMFATGEKPGPGLYMCMGCAQPLLLDNDDEALPACPHCGATRFMKL